MMQYSLVRRNGFLLGGFPLASPLEAEHVEEGKDYDLHVSKSRNSVSPS